MLWSDRYSVLEDLSPKARRLWKDILEEKLISGEEGREIYRETGNDEEMEY
jgi:hypothetical protein